MWTCKHGGNCGWAMGHKISLKHRAIAIQISYELKVHVIMHASPGMPDYRN